jgi:Ni/Co efflux regulator RcnB
MGISGTRPATFAKTFVAAAAALLVGATTAAADPRNDGQHSYPQSDGGVDAQHAGWGQDHQGGQHHWRRGQRMGFNDWSGAQRVDYRQHNLRQPPRGYEWRESNGQYVLAAVASGLIASIILSNGR